MSNQFEADMRILWLKTELLHPVDKGGKIRTYNMLKELKRNHHITYLTLDDGTADKDAREKAAEYSDELVCVPHSNREKFSLGFYAELVLNLLSPLPYFMKKYESAQMKSEISARASEKRFDVLVCDFLMPSINVPSEVNCVAVLFQHNVEAMIWKRHYEVENNPVKREYLRRQWLKSCAFERTITHRFDHVVSVSSADTETMRRDYGLANVSDVPTGVDTEFFSPRGAERLAAHNLVFTGSMDWLPNADAIGYFSEQILPRIKQVIPQVTLTVVGRNPSQSLIELSERDRSIVVTGSVEDVRPYVERASAYIVPLRVAGGTRLKIFEAMAMEKPVISTAVGAEGLPITDGVDLLLADTPEDFSNAVVKVLSDETFAQALARQGARKVRESFGWDKAALKFAEICRGALHLYNEKREKDSSVELVTSKK